MGSEYTYSKDGEFITWKDRQGLAVPLMLHTILREKALSEGVDSNIFLTNRLITLPKIEREKKVVSVGKKSITNKKGLIGGFNPFS
jgi:hypothetical protein